MSFGDLFPVDPPEPQPEPALEHAPPEWLDPPGGELPVAVPFGLVLARSQRGAVALSHALVHSTGVQFQVVAHVDGLRAGESNMIFHEQHAGRMGLPEPPGGLLRFGIELPGGARVSNLSAEGWRRSPRDEATGPVLMQSGGSGGGSSNGTSVDWSAGYWLWPLPEAGVLRLFCEWPVAEIGLTSAEIDAASIREAAEDVTRMWPPEAEGRGPWTRPVGSSGQTVSTMSFAAGNDEEPAAGVSPEKLAALHHALEHALALIDSLGQPD